MLGNLFILSLIVIYIVDISGAIDSLKVALWKLRKGLLTYKDYSLKPFDCSLCMVFWTGLIYLLVMGQFTLIGVAEVCLFSLISSPLGNLLVLVREALRTALYHLQNILLK